MFLGLPFFLLVARNRTLERSGLFSKTTTDVLASIMLVGLLLTFSRAAALLVAATLLLLLGKLRTSVTWIAAVVSVGAVVFMARAATPGEPWYGDSVEVRAGWAEEALTGSTKSIGSALFGTGLGTATTLTAEGIEVVQTDNMLLAFILELGFSGALAYSALLASVLWLMWATLRMRSPIAPVAGGLMAFGVMFALYTPVTVNARAFPPAMLFWLASGLMVQLAINDRTSRRAEPRSVPTD
jgi:O-antigen ligase